MKDVVLDAFVLLVGCLTWFEDGEQSARQAP